MIPLLNAIKNKNTVIGKIDLISESDLKQDFITLFNYTYDKLTYKFGLRSTDGIGESTGTHKEKMPVLFALLDYLNSNESAQNKKARVREYISTYRPVLLNLVLDRDLDIGINLKTYNRYFFPKIFKPQYMRCSMPSDYRESNFRYPAVLQEKIDGTYRTLSVTNSAVLGFTEWRSRSGEIYEHTLPNTDPRKLPDGIYIGELVVVGSADRYESNGLLNSLESANIPVKFLVWDYLYSNDGDHFSDSLAYEDRVDRLKRILKNLNSSDIEFVQSWEVNSYAEAEAKALEIIANGGEGGILKDWSTVFKDGTSKTQIKLKQIKDVDVAISGYVEGKGKRKGKIGALEFSSSDGLVTGSCSGFSDSVLDEMSVHFEKYLGRVITVRANDLTFKNGKHSLQHPRFMCFREDKKTADDLDRILAIFDKA